MRIKYEKKKKIFLPKLSGHFLKHFTGTGRSSIRTQMTLSKNVTFVHNQFSSVAQTCLIHNRLQF